MVTVDYYLCALRANYSFERTFVFPVLSFVQDSNLLAAQVWTINYSTFALCLYVPKQITIRKIKAAAVVWTLKLGTVKHSDHSFAWLGAAEQT
jgi:hypothetical protein